MAENTFLKSTFYEQLVEHVFIAEVLQEVWFRYGETVEVLRSEVDSSGYDVVFECGGVIRHVQLKTSGKDAKAASQKVNIALAAKPCGCVIWLRRSDVNAGDPLAYRMELSYLFFGGGVNEKLDLKDLKVAKHTKANSKGEKKFREAIRVVPKSRFKRFESTRALVEQLFGLTMRHVVAWALLFGAFSSGWFSRA